MNYHIIFTIFKFISFIQKWHFKSTWVSRDLMAQQLHFDWTGVGVFTFNLTAENGIVVVLLWHGEEAAKKRGATFLVQDYRMPKCGPLHTPKKRRYSKTLRCQKENSTMIIRAPLPCFFLQKAEYIYNTAIFQSEPLGQSINTMIFMKICLFILNLSLRFFMFSFQCFCV